MKFLKGFFSTLIVLVLVAIILGGVGYIGYNVLFVKHSGVHNSMVQNNIPNQNTQVQQNEQASSNAETHAQSQQTVEQNNSTTNQQHNQTALTQSNIALQNKEKVSRTILLLNESLSHISFDPYSRSNTQMDLKSQSKSNDSSNNKKVEANVSGQSGTVINIYPAEASQNNGGISSQGGEPKTVSQMQNMGNLYDANKMEQLHAGIYKISIGLALLNQLNDELGYQAETIGTNDQNTASYYQNQYYNSVQNKNKLLEASEYINQATDFININPYITQEGYVYDKDRMQQLHQGVFSLAQGVVSLEQLKDDITKQAIWYSNAASNASNQSNINTANNNQQQMNHSTMSSGLGIFNSINISTVANILLIVFVVGLILSIIGMFLSLLTSTTQKIS